MACGVALDNVMCECVMRFGTDDGTLQFPLLKINRINYIYKYGIWSSFTNLKNHKQEDPYPIPITIRLWMCSKFLKALIEEWANANLRQESSTFLKCLKTWAQVIEKLNFILDNWLGFIV